jgi:hypothetical protein
VVAGYAFVDGEDSEARSVRTWHSQRSREGSDIKPSGEGYDILSRAERKSRLESEIQSTRGGNSHPVEGEKRTRKWH